ncbi:unnamed protein product [Peniophora sp. CBMAI 1063]|nr:unnamed protein product [Peniophora sp. CBMAI 1063]
MPVMAWQSRPSSSDLDAAQYRAGAKLPVLHLPDRAAAVSPTSPTYLSSPTSQQSVSPTTPTATSPVTPSSDSGRRLLCCYECRRKKKGNCVRTPAGPCTRCLAGRDPYGNPLVCEYPTRSYQGQRTDLREYYQSGNVPRTSWASTGPRAGPRAVSKSNNAHSNSHTYMIPPVISPLDTDFSAQHQYALSAGSENTSPSPSPQSLRTKGKKLLFSD